MVATDRPDRAAINSVRLICADLEPACGVLVCRRARGLEMRRALELGVDGVVLSRSWRTRSRAVVSVVCAGQVSLPSAQRAEAGSQR